MVMNDEAFQLRHRVIVDWDGNGLNVDTVDGDSKVGRNSVYEIKRPSQYSPTIGRHQFGSAPGSGVLGFTFRRGLEFGGDRPFALDVAGQLSVTVSDPLGRFSQWGGGSYTDLVGHEIQVDLAAFGARDRSRYRGGWRSGDTYHAGDYVRRDTLGGDPQYHIAESTSTGIDPRNRSSEWAITNATTFDRFPLWSGFIESVTFTPMTSGHHIAQIEAYGSLRRLSELPLQMPAMENTNPADVVKQIIERSALTDNDVENALRTSPGDISVFYTQNQTILGALHDLAIADDSFIVERRRGAIWAISQSERNKIPRSSRRMAYIVAGSTQPQQGAATVSKGISLLGRHEGDGRVSNAMKHRERLKVDKNSAVTTEYESPVTYATEIDMVAPEVSLLNTIDWTRQRLTIEAATIVYSAPKETLTEDRSSPPQPLDVVDSLGSVIDPIEGVYVLQRTTGGTDADTIVDIFATAPSDAFAVLHEGGVIGNFDVRPTFSAEWGNAAGRARGDSAASNVTMTLVSSEPRAWHIRIEMGVGAGAEPIVITDVDIHGRIVRRIPLGTAQLTDAASVNAHGAVLRSYDNKFYSDGSANALARDRLRTAMSGQIARYNELRLRPIVKVRGDVAGRWVVEELVTPLNNVTLYADDLHLGQPENYIVRAVRYSVTPPDRTEIELMLQPVAMGDISRFQLGEPSGIIGNGGILGR